LTEQTLKSAETVTRHPLTAQVATCRAKQRQLKPLQHEAVTPPTAAPQEPSLATGFSCAWLPKKNNVSYFLHRQI
jgi:hypothetical protein